MRNWINLIESSDIDSEDGGWITSEGEIISCDKVNDLHHGDIAANYFGEEQDPYDEWDGTDIEDIEDAQSTAADFIDQAFDAGWIRFGSIGKEFFIEMKTASSTAIRKLKSISGFFSDEFATYAIEKHTIKRFTDLRSFKSRDCSTMRNWIKVLEDADPREEERLAAFRKLADDQRGKPELAMVRAQHIMGAGVLSAMIEHVGDLTHRISEMPDRIPNCGYEFVKPKVERALRTLENNYGFAREHDENMISNASYHSRDLDQHLNAVRNALRAYASAHQQLGVYNEAQRLARDAAVYLGQRNWQGSINCLRKLDTWLGDPLTWKEHASQYDPDFETRLTERMEIVSVRPYSMRTIETRIWRNPSLTELKAAIQRSQYGLVRGMVVHNTNEIIIWDAEICIHGCMWDALYDGTFNFDAFYVSFSTEAFDLGIDGGVYEAYQADIFLFGQIAKLHKLVGNAELIGHAGVLDDGSFGVISV